ncbi:MAG: VOC family protein [Pseudomonadota bacterium]
MAEPATVLAHATEVAFVRFQLPDFALQKTFLEDFGLTVLDASSSNDGNLYARGRDGRAFLYIAELGEPKFLGLGFQMSSRADLEALAMTEGASEIMPIDGPGGGEWVRLVDPNGLLVDAVYGQKIDPMELVEPRPPMNTTENKARFEEPVRLTPGPCCVRRVGHCVLEVRDFDVSETWYKERFGFITSDEIFAGEESNTVGAFMRCNLGTTPTDHHTLFLIGGREPGVNHVAFEVDNWDKVMLGHDHMKSGGYQAHWGVGKHILGSQVFDYWKDPYGNVVEHYTDGDLFTSSIPPKKEPVEKLLAVQWGPNIPH